MAVARTATQWDFVDTFAPPQDQNVTIFIGELAVPRAGIDPPKPQCRRRSAASVGAAERARKPGADTCRGRMGNGRIQELSGFGIPGVLLGLSYSPIDELTIGAAYRSKVWVNLSGTTTSEIPFVGALELKTTSRWYVPHMVRLGVAAHLWKRRLMFTLEFRTQFHEEANKEQRFELEGQPTTVARFDWKNVYLGVLATEIHVHSNFALRAAFTVGQSSSRAETVTPFSPPPGLQLGAYGGFGFHLGPMDVDISVGWGGGPSATIERNHSLCTPVATRPGTGADQVVAAGGCAGTHDVNSYFLGFSATYHHGRDG